MTIKRYNSSFIYVPLRRNKVKMQLCRGMKRYKYRGPYRLFYFLAHIYRYFIIFQEMFTVS